eukprot:14705826-Alexandrium_andersonii.AAC.1
MSASLVGSEMCIRDSLLGVGCAALAGCWPRHASMHCKLRIQVVLEFTPVSYTHLTLPTICSV